MSAYENKTGLTRKAPRPAGRKENGALRPAIKTLKSKKANNRLVSEILSHADFVSLMSAVEMYIGRKILPQIAGMNVMYQALESTIKERFDGEDKPLCDAYHAEPAI